MEIPKYEIQFNKHAEEVDPNEFREFQAELKRNWYSDIIVLAHGWNNNIDDARKLYDGLLEKISIAVTEKKDESKRFISLNIFWPSKKFTQRELIPGNAAGTTDAEESETAELLEEWKNMEDLLGDGSSVSYEKILEGIKQNKDGNALAPEILKIFSSLVSDQENNPFESLSTEEVKAFLEDGSIPYLEPLNDEGGASSVAGGNPQEGYASNLFSGIKQGIANAMNLTTYYQMKNRAGEIGTALNAKLAEIKFGNSNLNLHLIGHSFGARLVTSALLGPKKIHVKTLALLQAAFSHYGFSSKYDDISDGYFRKILTENKIKGALLITHTRADQAVSLAYALASRLGGQTADFLGDKDSLYGGLGGNGAQKTPGISNSVGLAQAASTNQFVVTKSYNLLSDNIITGHSDIVKDEVGQALANAFFLQ